LRKDAVAVPVTNAATVVSPVLPLDPGSYALSAKLYLVGDPTANPPSLVTCALVNSASLILDSTQASVPRDRSVPVSLAATLEVPDPSDSVRVVCSTGDVATPTAVSVKLIALQVGELG
jgi:hypothetical protein